MTNRKQSSVKKDLFLYQSEDVPFIKTIIHNRLKSDAINPYEALAYLLALETGLRASDLLRLKTDSVKSDLNGRYYIVSDIQKTKETNHRVWISKETYNLIQNIIDTKSIFNRNQFLFTNPKTHKQFTRFWLYKRSKLMFGYNFHNLRKVSAKHILKVGTLADAQRHLAHKRITTTDHYLNVSEKDSLERIKSLYGY